MPTARTTPAALQARELLESAQASGIEPTIVHASGTTIIVLGSREPAADDFLSLEETRVFAKLRTTRPLRDAVHAGELEAFGNQRNRLIRRADAIAWIESRKVKPIAGADDLAMEKRIARLERARAKRAS